MNEITIGDKIYISSKRAAEITGYAKDYVGQLCREGHVDAKMVGRSWYVYEPSIRAHRFGEAVEEPVKAATEEIPAVAVKPEEPVSTWERATYTSEEPQTIPEVQSPRLEELLPPAEETLTDMQEAWKEWFERKQSGVEAPENAPVQEEEEQEEDVIEDEDKEVEEEEAVAIPLHHISEEQEIEEEEPQPVPIRPVYPQEVAPVVHTPAPRYVEPTRYTPERREEQVTLDARIITERIVTKKPGRRTRKSHAPAIALLLSLSLCVVAITIIGTGYADNYLKTLGDENPVVNFIHGTSEFKR
jgi:hypothetical protein